MPSRKPAGVRLASHDGAHLEWTDPVLTRTPDGRYGMAIDCHFAGVRVLHWLVPDAGSYGVPRFTFRDLPYGWGSAGEAADALEWYRAQQSAAD